MTENNSATTPPEEGMTEIETIITGETGIAIVTGGETMTTINQSVTITEDVRTGTRGGDQEDHPVGSVHDVPPAERDREAEAEANLLGGRLITAAAEKET